MTSEARIIARLDSIGELLERDIGRPLYTEKVSEKLKDTLVGWHTPAEALPVDDRPVFFLTVEGNHWAGARKGDDMVDWGDKGLICTVADVAMWEYAPEVKA